MVIGVWTNKTDSINKELYSLRIHQNINNETQDLGIIELNSDQKVICKPKSFRDGYNTVLFAVIGGVLGAIVIGLVVVIVVIQIKNKSLMNKVKHISFQKTNAVTDPNLLLQKQTDTINNA